VYHSATWASRFGSAKLRKVFGNAKFLSPFFGRMWIFIEFLLKPSSQSVLYPTQFTLNKSYAIHSKFSVFIAMIR
ncbi:hypothetical protein, partial [uncultured Duncaniella sp.]|uniref:hypothetical protein n=1 Tax=uncultured Duncaniella sp. TaxID=2768039 RepID=UPI0025B6F8D3